jgi:hypothetical protein
MKPRLYIHKKKFVLWLFVLVVFGSLCTGVYYYFIKTASNPVASSGNGQDFFLARFRRYGVSTSDVSNIQEAQLSYGQGVYLRFEANSGFINKILKNLPEDSKPYEAISCPDPFYTSEITKEWITWWKPEETISPKCYVTRICEYFLVDSGSRVVYFYEKPGWASSHNICVP